MPKAKQLAAPKTDSLTKLLRGEFGTGAALVRTLGCAPGTGLEILALPRKRLTVERLMKLSGHIDAAELASAVFGRKLVLSNEK